MDLVTSGPYGVSISIGDGLGNFSPAINFAAGIFTRSVISADFNADGKMDVATANANSNNISVLVGDGLGSFSSATNFAVGTAPNSITTADFNGDGKLDLATANNNSKNVSIVLGNGLGSFSTATNFSVGTSPKAITAADFNADGKMDVATGNSNSTGNANSSTVSIITGDGLGGFSAATNFAVGVSPEAIASADFNGDGKMDIATSSYNISVMLNNIPNVSVSVR